MKRSKFKVGDLVTLSAAGHKMGQNWRYRGGFGVVTASAIHDGDRYPITCYWMRKNEQIPGYFKPYELKFFKPDKK